MIKLLSLLIKETSINLVFLRLKASLVTCVPLQHWDNKKHILTDHSSFSTGWTSNLLGGNYGFTRPFAMWKKDVVCTWKDPLEITTTWGNLAIVTSNSYASTLCFKFIILKHLHTWIGWVTFSFQEQKKRVGYFVIIILPIFLVNSLLFQYYCENIHIVLEGMIISV